MKNIFPGPLSWCCAAVPPPPPPKLNAKLKVSIRRQSVIALHGCRLHLICGQAGRQPATLQLNEIEFPPPFAAQSTPTSIPLCCCCVSRTVGTITDTTGQQQYYHRIVLLLAVLPREISPLLSFAPWPSYLGGQSTYFADKVPTFLLQAINCLLCEASSGLVGSGQASGNSPTAPAA